MVKELISKCLTILLVLFALHATAGSVEPVSSKSEKGKIEASASIESDSTESKNSTAQIDKVTDKVAETTKSSLDNDELDSSDSSSPSIVSFNFVYYLLEKFKFSDLLGR